MELYRDEQTEWNGDTGTITGTAVYEVDPQMDFSADIGGVDGWTVSATLIRVEIDGWSIDRCGIVLIVGESSVRAAEQAFAEKIARQMGEGE
jgi:hypothetical protein